MFSDLQFYHNPSKSRILTNGRYSWLEEQLKVLDQLFDFANEKEVETIIHNGDLFEQKNLINVATYNILWEYFSSRKKDFDLIFNTGNHDYFSDNRESSLKPFSEIAIIIDEPWDYWIDDNVLRFLPHGMIDGYLETPQTNGFKFLFTHENIAGLKIGPKDYVSGSQYKPHIFDGWTNVFNGHIHKPQQLNNIINIGSPMIQDFGEVGDVKRFLYFDGEIVHSINTNCPQFYILYDIKEDLINDRDYFRIDITSDKLDHEVFKRWNVYPNVVSTSREASVRLSETVSLEEELQRYLNIVETELDKDKLLNYGLKFIRGE